MRIFFLGSLAMAALIYPSSSVLAQQPSSLFDSHELIELTISAPFPELFEASQKNPAHAVAGKVSYTDVRSGRAISIENVQVQTRGHTSRREAECAFPKLKLDFDGEAPKDSVFAGVDSLKLGTHCGDRPDGELTPKYGRWANDKAPHREAFVYRLLDVMGVPSLKARPARVTYITTAAGAARGAPLVRNAMLLEDDDDAIARLGGTGQLDPKTFDSAQSAFTADDTARLAFAEAMIGNFDWCLRMVPGDTYRCNDTNPLWNVIGVQRKSGGTVPVVHDFDLAGLVTGRHVWFGKVFNEGFARSQPEVEVLAQTQRTRSLFTRNVIDRARAHFNARKTAAYDVAGSSTLDADGRQHVKAYLDSFFETIASDGAFYRPVVADSRARMYLNASRLQPACGTGQIPAGTPVSAPLETRGDMSKVLVLDALWEWAEACEVLRKGPVWIPTAAIGTNYPR